jgi:hypothetical protein
MRAPFSKDALCIFRRGVTSGKHRKYMTCRTSSDFVRRDVASLRLAGFVSALEAVLFHWFVAET